jgi:Polysaccharide lyase
LTTLVCNNFLAISYKYKAIPKHLQHFFSTWVLLTLLSSVTLQNSVFAKAPYSIQVSTNPNRENPITSEVKFFSGNLYIFVSPAKDISKVEFFLDSPDGRGFLRHLERKAPFDFAGGTTNLANPFDSNTTRNGEHTITAKITSKRGKTEIISYTFSIANPKENQSTQAQKSRPSSPIPHVTKVKISPSLLFKSDFEQGDLGGWYKEICCSDSVQSVSVPVRSGNFALKFYLRKNDPDTMSGRRAELALKPVPANAERWYEFSIFLPDNWTADPVTDIVAQWHEYPDFSVGESWRSPPLSLSTVDGNWRIGRIWDPNPLTLKNTPGLGGGTERIDLGGYEVGRWTDWIIHVKWSHQPNGLLEIWRNGNLVVQRTGPNTYNDKVGPYFKMGIYKPDWKYKPEKSTTETRTIYFDEIRVGDKSAGYTDIAPH